MENNQKLTQLAFHLIATPDFVDKFTLKGVNVGISIAKLCHAQLAQLRDAMVGSIRLDIELDERHILRTKKRAHLDLLAWWCTFDRIQSIPIFADSRTESETKCSNRAAFDPAKGQMIYS